MQQLQSFTPSELRSASFRTWVAELYQRTPKLLGTTASLPSPGSTYVPRTTEDRHVLIRTDKTGTDSEYVCFVNSCAHLQLKFIPVGKIFDGKEVERQGKLGTLRFIVCPWHERGHRTNSGEFITKPGEQCRRLRKVETVRLGDLIFEAADGSLPSFEALINSPKFAELGIKPFEIPTNFRLVRTSDTPERFDAITGAANFAEDAHVGPSHRSTYAFLYDMKTLYVVVIDREWSAQFVGWHKAERAMPQNACGELRRLILARTGGVAPAFGVIWYQFGAFDTMERFSIGTDVSDHVIVVSSFIPTKSGVGSRNVVEFYFPENVASDSEFVDAFMAAYNEPGAEDRDLCLSAEEGYDARIESGYGDDPIIPSDSKEERCLLNYYNYLRQLEATYGRHSANREAPALLKFAESH